MKSLISVLFFFCLSANGISANTTNPISFESKSETCKRIFNDLKNTKGLLPSQAPFFHLVRELPNPNFAIAMAQGVSVFLDEATYDECVKMGDEAENALAFILAHELAHFTKDHIERHRFIEEQKEEESNERMNVLTTSNLNESDTELTTLKKEFDRISHKYEIRKNEAEADLEAGFMSYLAGYKSLTAGPQMLDRVYKRFKIDPKGGNYASLNERKEIIRNTTIQLDSLVQIFEAANLATALGVTDLALDGYEYVGKKFESPNLYNNMGVTILMNQTKEMSLSDIPYLLPLTLDIEIMEFSSEIGEMTEEERERLRRIYEKKIKDINRSINYFDHAFHISPSYYVAHINKSIAHYVKYVVIKNREGIYHKDLNDELQLAYASVVLAKRSILKYQKDNKKALSDVFALQGIMEDILNQKDKAKELLNEAEKLDSTSYLVYVNKKVLDNKRARREIMWDMPEHIEIENNIDQNLVNDDRIDIAYNATSDMEEEGSSAELLPDGLEMKEALKTFKNNWDYIRLIKTQNPDSALPIKLLLKTKAQEKYDCFEWEKRKGRTRVLKSLSLAVINKNKDVKTSKGISKGSTLDQAKEKYGYSFETLQTPNGTLVKFNTGNIQEGNNMTEKTILFLFKKGRVQSWCMGELYVRDFFK